MRGLFQLQDQEANLRLNIKSVKQGKGKYTKSPIPASFQKVRKHGRDCVKVKAKYIQRAPPCTLKYNCSVKRCRDCISPSLLHHPYVVCNTFWHAIISYIFNVLFSCFRTFLRSQFQACKNCVKCQLESDADQPLSVPVFAKPISCSTESCTEN